MKTARWIAAGAGLAAVGAAAAYAQYRQTEQPDYSVVRADADFELRDYPALVVAEVSNAGSRERASGGRASAGSRPISSRRTAQKAARRSP